MSKKHLKIKWEHITDWIPGNVSPRHLEMHMKYNKYVYKWKSNLWAKKKKQIGNLETRMLN